MQDLDIIGLFTRPGTYILGVGIFIVVFMIRKIVESAWPKLKKQADANDPKLTYLTSMARWWNEVILYLLPVILGSFCGLIKSDFLFAGIGVKGGKIIFGAVVGWFASFLYKLLRRVIKQKTGVDIIPDVSASDIDTPAGG
ncbi:MAG: hypothetical protein WC708_00530 [Lentisphaeria bacterium]